jgi:hypothetical protein
MWGLCLRAFVLFVCCSSLAAAQQLRYNPYTKQRELVGPGETLQYNPYIRKREYAPEGAMPRYNPYTKQRELVGRD